MENIKRKFLIHPLLKRISSNNSLLIVIVISILFVFPLLKPGFYTMYDDMQIVRLWQMDKCFKDWQFPCRWVPDLGLGYGYPLYNYYAPLPYYVMELIHLIGISLVESVIIGFILSVVLSSVLFYKFLRLRFSRLSSIIGTIIFIYTPLRASDLYVRGAMGELWGMVSIAFILYGIDKLIIKSRLLEKALFVLTVFVFFSSHNLTTLIFIPFIVGYAIIRFIEVKYPLKKIIELIILGTIGTCLSAFYILPMYFERNLVHIDTLTSGYFGYLQHFLSLKQIFISSIWGYGPSIYGPNDDAFLGIGPIHTLVFVSATLLFINKVRKDHNNYRNYILPVYLLFSFFLFTFLVHERSTFIYKLIPVLQTIQFPWRYVLLSMYIIPLLFVYVIDKLSKNIVLSIAGLITLLLLTFYIPIFKPKDWFSLTDKEKLSNGQLKKQLTASIYDYLPIVAKKAPDDIPYVNTVPIDGKYKEITYLKGSNWYDVQLDITSAQASLALPSYNYPNWEVYLDRNIIPVVSYGDYGLISFSLPFGKHRIIAKQIDTPIRVIANSISLLSAAILLGYVLYEKNKKYFFSK